MKSFPIKCSSIYLLLFFTIQSAFANQVSIGNLEVKENGKISFNLSWQNSWRLAESPANHDAVWVFFKITDKQLIYKHLQLSQGTVLKLGSPELKGTISEDFTGIIFTRAIAGSGHILPTAVEITLPYLLPDTFIIKAFAIEMVYVPQGEFYIGDSISKNSFCEGDSGKPFRIGAQNLVSGAEAGKLNALENALLPASFNSNFPSGYQGFYAMKYEISQEQYADFLNTLSMAQQETRTLVSPNSEAGTFAMCYAVNQRNGIIISAPATENTPAVYACNATTDGSINAENDGQWRAMNWLNWADLAAYLDWAALRPLTETEFEKLARGNENYPIKGEFAWGTEWIIDANTMKNDGTEQESVVEIGTDTHGLASHGYDGVAGPLRVGFAANESTGRIASGSGFYGAFELSGNVWEMCVAISPENQLFDDSNGDGLLTDDGNANVNNWPNPETAVGAIYKGGGWFSGIYQPGSFRDLAVSDRFYVALPPTQRRDTSGGRGAKTCHVCEM